MSSTRRHFTGRTSLALPALGAALALVVTSCSAALIRCFWYRGVFFW